MRDYIKEMKDTIKKVNEIAIKGLKVQLNIKYVPGDYVNFTGIEMEKPEFKVLGFEIDKDTNQSPIEEYLLVNVEDIHSGVKNQYLTKDLKISKKWK
jgi:hypothetical protein